MIRLRGQIKSFQGGESPTILVVFSGKDSKGKVASASLDIQVSMAEVKEIKLGSIVEITVNFDPKDVFG